MIAFEIDNPNARIQVLNGGPDPLFEYLHIDEQRLYATRSQCGTCDFWFERLPDTTPPGTLMASEMQERLYHGKDLWQEDVLDTLKAILPSGKYIAMLYTIKPTLVHPEHSDDNEYFRRDRGESYDENNPYPYTHYYRSAGGFLEGSLNRYLFNFVMPFQTEEQLDFARLNHYRWLAPDGAEDWPEDVHFDFPAPDDCPTVLAYAQLSLHHNIHAHHEAEIQESLILSQYVLDGHHKLHAAALDRTTIQMLAFVRITEFISMDRATAALSMLEHSWRRSRF